MCLSIVTLSLTAGGGKLTEAFARSPCLISFYSICKAAVEMASNRTGVMLRVIAAVLARDLMLSGLAGSGA